MSYINDVTALGGGGGQGFCDNSIEAFVIKRVTMGGGGGEIVHNCLTSLMDDPFGYLDIFEIFCEYQLFCYQ